MRDKAGVACGIILLTLVGFIRFPGRTYLQSDTQIYVPMLERIYDPASLPRDLVAEKPHLGFTVYDEVTLGLHWLGLSYELSLVTQQMLFRTLQNAGIYLLAASLVPTVAQALAVTAIAGLGAAIPGPSVLLVEYEPIPRAFAVALIFLAIGLAAQRRSWLASTAASIAFLYHAPYHHPVLAGVAPEMAALVFRGRGNIPSL
jgi:hypothetical protein